MNNIIYGVLALIVIVYIYNKYSKNDLIPTQDQTTSHKAKAIVLHCMDFRLVDDLVKDMDKLGLNNNYDDIVLAGGSVLVNDKFDCPSCNKGSYNILKNSELYKSKHITFYNYFLDHLRIAINLHDIERVILVEHDDCGAYKVTYGNKNYDPNYHIDNMRLFKENFDSIRKLLKSENIDEEFKHKVDKLALEFYMLDLQGILRRVDV